MTVEKSTEGQDGVRKNRNKRIVVFIGIVILTIGVGVAFTPTIINTWFSSYPVQDINTTMLHTGQELGEVVVIQGVLNNANTKYIITEKINCIPEWDQYYYFAGAWGYADHDDYKLGSQTFYIVWVVDGC